jgi:hypothetical protein
MYLKAATSIAAGFDPPAARSGSQRRPGPFDHGFMVDADREKISSKGAQGAYGRKPQAYIKIQRGHRPAIDPSQDFRNDIIVSEERIKTVAETYQVPAQRAALPAFQSLRL